VAEIGIGEDAVEEAEFCLGSSAAKTSPQNRKEAKRNTNCRENFIRKKASLSSFD
jgi:hypothetical protein